MNFIVPQQEKDFWCWAAVTVGVDRFFTPKSKLTQCGIVLKVLKVKKGCNDPSCDEPARLQDSLSAAGVLDKTLGPLTYDQVRAQIDAGRPVCIRVAWNDGGAHFAVIYGYRLMKSGVQLVDVADPFFQDSTMAFNDLLSAYQNSEIPDGGGQWTNSFTVKAKKQQSKNEE